MGVAAEEPAQLRAQQRGPALFRLVRRSATLHGNVPLRAAQACAPFLQGNAAGLHLEPARPISLRRGFRALEVKPAPLRAEALGAHAVRVTFDTGLTLQPPAGAVLVIERAYNRRDHRVTVPQQVLRPGGELHLTLEVALRRADGEITLTGELASLLAFPAAARARLCALREAPAVGQAHLAFFDAAYFQHKRGAVTRKYRHLLNEDEPRPADAAAGDEVLVVHGGGALPSVGQDRAGVLGLTLPVEVPTRLGYHGQRVEATLDDAPRGRRAAEIEACWREVFGAAAEPSCGAVRYFTTYVTPHSRGDPHLFFKPATLLRAPPGWCAVIDGPLLPGCEVLRGVTEAAWFHALPAVLEVQRGAVALAPGSPLLRVRPLPRRLLDVELCWEPPAG